MGDTRTKQVSSSTDDLQNECLQDFFYIPIFEVAVVQKIEPDIFSHSYPQSILKEP